MSPIEGFATGITIFDQQKLCLIAWSSLLKHLISWILWSKVKLEPYLLDPLIFTVWRLLDPLIALKKGFHHLIEFWSWLQTLLHGTHNWLLLDTLRDIVASSLFFVLRCMGGWQAPSYWVYTGDVNHKSILEFQGSCLTFTVWWLLKNTYIQWNQQLYQQLSRPWGWCSLYNKILSMEPSNSSVTQHNIIVVQSSISK